MNDSWIFLFGWIMPWGLWSQLLVIYYVQCALNETYCHTHQLDWLNLSSPKIPLPNRSYSRAALSKRSPKRSSAQLDKEELVIVITRQQSEKQCHCSDTVLVSTVMQREKLITQTQLPEILNLSCVFLSRQQTAVKW